MRSLGWTVIQYDWHLYKKRKSGHRHMQKEEKEDGHQQVNKRDLEQLLCLWTLEGINPADALILNF